MESYEGSLLAWHLHQYPVQRRLLPENLNYLHEAESFPRRDSALPTQMSKQRSRINIRSVSPMKIVEICDFLRELFSAFNRPKSLPRYYEHESKSVEKISKACGFGMFQCVQN